MDEDIIRSIIILALVVLVAFAVIFFNFFLVIIKGAMEEEDEEYEFCKLARISYRNGKWYVNAGAWFDDNAALRITFGIAFIVFFHDFDFVLVTGGNKVGSVNGIICQNLIMLRRKIRRI